MSLSKKTVLIRGREIGGHQPLICTPLIGQGIPDLAEELGKIIPKNPDIIEWRADFFAHLTDIQEVLHAAHKIRELSGEIPILFTIRSDKEGGQPIALSENEKLRLISEICQAGVIDVIDYELVNEREVISRIREVSKKSGVNLILSYHNFDSTPDIEFIVDKLHQAERLGADIAKVAVMPNSKEDVLALLSATNEAQKDLTIPMVTISMGELGVITRIAGWVFGSNLTFAIGNESSAPGQIPIQDLRGAIQFIQRVSMDT